MCARGGGVEYTLQTCCACGLPCVDVAFHAADLVLLAENVNGGGTIETGRRKLHTCQFGSQRCRNARVIFIKYVIYPYNTKEIIRLTKCPFSLNACVILEHKAIS